VGALLRAIDHILELAQEQNRRDLAAIAAAPAARLIGLLRARAADLQEAERQVEALGAELARGWGQF
jgi:hypothetical protein